MATPVIAMQMQMQGNASASPSASASGSAVHTALRSGAAMELGLPFLVLAARVSILALGHLRSSSEVLQQPRLSFPLPAGLDENALFDLYVIGLGSAVLLFVVPCLEIVGNLLGHMLTGASAAWGVLALLVVPAGVYFALGAWLKASSRPKGTRPTKIMWGLCGAGHVAFVSGCFYSPDVARATGFLVGLVHIARLLQQVFAYPAAAAAGAGMCEEAGGGVVEL